MLHMYVCARGNGVRVYQEGRWHRGLLVHMFYNRHVGDAKGGGAGRGVTQPFLAA